MTLWTDERTEEAKRRWLGGESASQIARAMGEGLSRHSVVGKMWRLGISSPTLRTASAVRIVAAQPVAVRARAKPAAVPRQEPSFAPQPLASLRVIEVSSRPVNLLALEPAMCRWPVAGDGPDTLFCGAPKLGEGCSYCKAHFKLSRQPPQGKKHSAAELIRACRRYA